MALGRLEAARALMQPGRAREFSIEVSGIVREYIERRFHVMAAHRTTHEFLHDLVLSADPALAAHRDLLGEFLQSCDLAKFGGWNLNIEPDEHDAGRRAPFHPIRCRLHLHLRFRRPRRCNAGRVRTASHGAGGVERPFRFG